MIPDQLALTEITPIFFFFCFFASLKVCSASPLLTHCRAAYLPGRNVIVLQLRSRQTCGNKHTQLIASHPSELSEWVWGCVWGFFFSFFFLFLPFNMLSQIRKCDAVTVRKGRGHTMALCLLLGLVAWEAPEWRPLFCFFFCCCSTLWPAQVRLEDYFV